MKQEGELAAVGVVESSGDAEGDDEVGDLVASVPSAEEERRVDRRQCCDGVGKRRSRRRGGGLLL